MTNADKYFRHATDEELAEWIAKHMYCAEKKEVTTHEPIHPGGMA